MSNIELLEHPQYAEYCNITTFRNVIEITKDGQADTMLFNTLYRISNQLLSKNITKIYNMNIVDNNILYLWYVALLDKETDLDHQDKVYGNGSGPCHQ